MEILTGVGKISTLANIAGATVSIVNSITGAPVFNGTTNASGVAADVNGNKPSLPYGTYVISVAMTGYITATQIFSVPATTSLSINLVSATGTINISSTPSGAEIFIDGVDQGVTTPFTIPKLSPGTHTYRLVLSGYISATGTITIAAGQTVSVIISISQLPMYPWPGTETDINNPGYYVGWFQSGCPGAANYPYSPAPGWTATCLQSHSNASGMYNSNLHGGCVTCIMSQLKLVYPPG
jgi:hypothetical protein